MLETTHTYTLKSEYNSTALIKETSSMGDVSNSEYGDSVNALLLKRLGVNVISIVLGGLFLVMIIAWFETLRAFCSSVIDDGWRRDRYSIVKRRLISSVTITLFVIFIAIIICSLASGK